MNSVPNIIVDASASTVSQDAILVFSIFDNNGIAVLDSDAGGGIESVTLSAGHGTVKILSFSGVTITGGANNSGSVTFTGTLQDLNTALSEISYRGASGYFGPDALTITINDLGNSGPGGPQSATEVVPITITLDQPGTTTNDTATGVEDTAIQVDAAHGVLANDSDPDGAMTIVDRTLTTAGGGHIVFEADGSYAYGPAAGFSGTDTVTYTAQDPGGHQITGTLTIEVAPAAYSPFVSAGSQLSEKHILVAGPGQLGNGILTTSAPMVALKGGGYVAILTYLEQANGNTTELQAYSADGTPVGPRFEPGLSRDLTVKALAGGGYVVAFGSGSLDDNGNQSVTVQAFDAAGQPAGAPYVELGENYGRLATAAPLPDGGFVVLTRDGPTQLLVQAFDATGLPAGAAVPLGTAEQGRAPTVLPNGEIVLMRTQTNGASDGLHLQRFDSQGHALAPAFLVDPFDDNDIASTVSVTALANGNYAVGWASRPDLHDDVPHILHVQIVDASDHLVGSQTAVNLEFTSILGQPRPQITALDNGGYVLSWRGAWTADHTEIQLGGQVYDANGQAVGDPIVFLSKPPTGMILRISAVEGGFVAIPVPGADDLGRVAQVFDYQGGKIGEVRLADSGDGVSENEGLTRLPNGDLIVTQTETNFLLGTSRVVVEHLNVSDGSHGVKVDNGAVSFAEDTTGAVKFVISLADQDGSEIISRLEVAGVPEGWGLAYPGAIAVRDAVSGVWTISGAAVQHGGEINLLLTPPQDVSGSATLTVTAHAEETATHQAAASLPINLQVTVTPVNDAPVNTVPGTLTAQHAVNAAITGLAVHDPDAVSLTTSLHVEHGTLNVAAISGGATVAGSGTSTVTLTGSAAQIDATLAASNNVLYRSFDFKGLDHLTMTSNDHGSSGGGGPLGDIDTFDIQVGADIPAYTINGFTRPALITDPTGHIILDQATADFVSTYGTKALYLGLPASTPYPPVPPQDFHLV